MTSNTPSKRAYIASPTESELTIRGKRHPNLARYLSSRDWCVEYISSNFSHAEKRLFTDEEHSRVARGLPYRLLLLKVGAYSRNLSLRRILWNQLFAVKCYRHLSGVLRKGDVLIVPSRPPELIYAAARLRRKSGCRVLLDIRDIWPDALSGSTQGARRIFGWYCDLFLKRAVMYCDAYVHVAPSFVPWLKRYAPQAQSHFIPLGFDEARWRGAGQCPQPLQLKPLRLVYCGTLTDQFNIMPVLEAMRERRGRFNLTLIGDNGSGERYKQVTAFVSAAGLSAEVTNLGLLPPAELVAELPRHHVSVVPMVSGALPNKVFDSMAVGIPMLSLGRGDSASLVQQHDIGWTSSFDPQAVGAVLDGITCAGLIEKSANVLKCRPAYGSQALLGQFAAVLAKVWRADEADGNEPADDGPAVSVPLSSNLASD